MAKRYLAIFLFNLINLCTFVQSCQNKQVLRENSLKNKIMIYSITLLQTCTLFFFLYNTKARIKKKKYAALDMQCQLVTKDCQTTKKKNTFSFCLMCNFFRSCLMFIN